MARASLPPAPTAVILPHCLVHQRQVRLLLMLLVSKLVVLMVVWALKGASTQSCLTASCTNGRHNLLSHPFPSSLNTHCIAVRAWSFHTIFLADMTLLSLSHPSHVPHPTILPIHQSVRGGHEVYVLDMSARLPSISHALQGAQIDSFFVEASISSDGSRVACGGSDGNINVWQLSSNDTMPSVTFQAHQGEVTALRWSPVDGDSMLSAADDSSVALHTLHPLPPHSPPPRLSSSACHRLPGRETRSWRPGTSVLVGAVPGRVVTEIAEAAEAAGAAVTADAAIRLPETTETGVEAAEAGEAAQHTAALPEPTAALPEPTAALPEPTAALPQPTAALPQPTAALPQSTAALPQSTAAVPETATTMTGPQAAPREAAAEKPEAAQAMVRAAPNTGCTDMEEVGMHEMAEQEDRFHYVGMHADAACRSHGEKQGGDDMETQDALCSAGMHVDAQYPPASRRKPPLLMLHGFGASAIWQWTNQVAAFSRDFDVVLPDLVFFGGSRSRSDQRSEIFQADVMLRLLDRLEIAECALVGLSYGGFVAYRMACLEPGRVQRLVLAASGFMTSAEEHAAVLGEWQVAHIAELLLPDDPKGVQRLMRLAYAKDVPTLPDWVLRSTHEALFDNQEEKRSMLDEVLKYLSQSGLNEAGPNETGLNETGPSGTRVDGTGPSAAGVDGKRESAAPPLQALNPHDIPVPQMETLLVWGSQDSIFPLSVAHRMHSHFGPMASLEVLEGASHALNIHRPKPFNDAVMRFLLDGTNVNSSA
ncbi:unnamed protein product [Closterium sp. Yama58-4]|nr:unnamed protein product [Closterium sp. Yama58-4]